MEQGSGQPDDAEKRTIYGIETTVVRFDDAEFFVPDYAAHRPVSRRVLDHQKVSPGLHVMVRRLMAHRPGSMVHAGTFFGDMLPSFSRKTPGVVHAFEPVMENYLLARAVVRRNGLENVRLLHAALGAEPGEAVVGVARRGRHLGGAARILGPDPEPHGRTQRVVVLTVDQLALEDLVLVQLDTEGSELSILRGATRTLREQQPVVVVEDNRDNCGEFLSGLGYVELGRVERDAVHVPEARAEELADVLGGVLRLPPFPGPQ